MLVIIVIAFWVNFFWEIFGGWLFGFCLNIFEMESLFFLLGWLVYFWIVVVREFVILGFINFLE